MRVSVWVAVVCPGTSRVLLAKRANTTRNAGRWNFFGGRIDSGEHPEQTALRELSEEAGIEAKRDALLYLGACYTGAKRNLLFVVTAEAEFDPLINHESQDWCWVSIDELLSWRRLHGPTEKLSPLVHSWVKTLPELDTPEPDALVPASPSRWNWLVRQVARHWPGSSA